MATTRPHVYTDGSESTRWTVTEHSDEFWTFACGDCGYSTDNIMALAGHNRRHDVRAEEPRRQQKIA